MSHGQGKFVVKETRSLNQSFKNERKRQLLILKTTMIFSKWQVLVLFWLTSVTLQLSYKTTSCSSKVEKFRAHSSIKSPWISYFTSETHLFPYHKEFWKRNLLYINRENILFLIHMICLMPLSLYTFIWQLDGWVNPKKFLILVDNDAAICFDFLCRVDWARAQRAHRQVGTCISPEI